MEVWGTQATEIVQYCLGIKFEGEVAREKARECRLWRVLKPMQIYFILSPKTFSVHEALGVWEIQWKLRPLAKKINTWQFHY